MRYKYKIFSFSFLILITSFLFIQIVSAKSVIKTCTYEDDIVFKIYDDDSAPYTSKTIFGEKIVNWDSTDYEYDAKIDWEETNTCPRYVIDIGIAQTKYVFSDEEHKSSFSENKNYIYSLISSDPADPYIPGNSYTCKYDGFSIEFNSEGYAVDITFSNTITENDRKSYGLDVSLTEHAYSPGVCPNVNFCSTSYASDSSTGVKITTYLVGSDSMALENSNECRTGVSTSEYKICEDGENCKGSVFVCGTYSDLLNEVEENYDCSISDPSCLYDSKSESKLKTLCNSVLAHANFDDGCLQKCLKLGDDIKNIKNTQPLETQCGFSQKLLYWIANIVRWIKYIIPVAVIVLGILDFIKAVGADKDDEMKKAQGRFVKRLIAAALIFIIPFIIEFVLDKMGFGEYISGCGIIDL